MPKKLIFATFLSTVLLLLISAQALAVSCGVRCALTPPSAGCHSADLAVSATHCHSMQTGYENGLHLSASNSCTASPCRQKFDATVKKAEPDGAPNGLLSSVGVLSPDPARGLASAEAASLPFVLSRWSGAGVVPSSSIFLLRI